jgi:MFS family permease
MLAASPVAGVLFWRHESTLARRGGTPLVNPELVSKPGLAVGLAGVLLFYVMSAFFLTFSVYLQGALGASALSAGLVFVPCGVGFFIGPLTTPLAIRAFGRFVPAIGMLCEVVGCVLLCLVVAVVPAGHYPARLPMDAALWLIGFGQGWALPTLVRSVIDRGPVGGSGMISGIVNSALQISAALGVAVIGGVFYAVAGVHSSPASMAHALIVAMLCVAGCLVVSAALSVRATAKPGGGVVRRGSAA